MKIAHALGLPLPFPWRGQTYWMRPATWGMLGQLELLLAGKALERVERSSPPDGTAVRAARIDQIVKLIEAGVFDQGRQGLRPGPSTLPLLAWLMLRDGQPAPTLGTVEEMVRVDSASVLARMRLLNVPGPDVDTQGQPVPFATMAAFLAERPWQLDLAAIAELTPYQTRAVYNHARDSDGKLELESSSREERIRRFRETFLAVHKKQGLADDEIERRWQQMFDKSLKTESQVVTRPLP